MSTNARRAVQGVAVALSMLAASPTLAQDVGVRSAVLRIDGADVGIETREEAAAPEQVLAAYAASWRRERPDEPVVESTVGAWRVLGQRLGAQYRTVQIAAGTEGRVHVVIARRELRGRRPPARPPIDLPPGSRVLRTVESRDRDRAAAQFAVQVPAGGADAWNAIRTRFEREGWRPVPGSEPAVRSPRAAVWQRGAEELLAVAVPAGAATTVLLHVTSAAVREGSAR